jgi:ornithine cyclodeaminase
MAAEPGPKGVLMSITILNERELRACVKLNREAIDAVADAFTALAEGGVQMPPIVHLTVPEHRGEMDVKTAYVPGFDSFALKVSTGFFDNPKRGLPSLSGMMTLLDSTTGRVRAVLLDNGYLTDVRTAAAGAVAADRLARADAKVAAVLGTGLQARMQIEALALVRPLQQIRVWGRDIEKARAYAAEMRERLGCGVEVCARAEDAVRPADVVITTTPAKEPILSADWLEPGVHITAMGSDAADKNEVDPRAFARAERVVVDRRAQCLRLGELHSAVAASALREDSPLTELGEITAGQAPGREDDRHVTLCDLTGTGVQDTAIANLAFRLASAQGYGTAIDA